MICFVPYNDSLTLVPGRQDLFLYNRSTFQIITSLRFWSVHLAALACPVSALSWGLNFSPLTLPAELPGFIPTANYYVKDRKSCSVLSQNCFYFNMDKYESQPLTTSL